MKRFLLIFAMQLCFSIYSAAQNDLIILRNGRETTANIIQVNDREIIYAESNKKNSAEFAIPNTEVYMLRFAKRGNVYITNDGKRVTGENRILPKDADVIYLVEGQEIPAYDLRIMEDRITYLAKKNKNKNVVPIAEVLPRSAVFMVKYTDGTTDVLTDITLKKELPQPVKEESTAQPTEEDEELEVVFHSVKKGETLSSIASRYNVAINDIIKWNDLPSTTKPTAKLRADMQLMIYVAPIGKNELP